MESIESVYSASLQTTTSYPISKYINVWSKRNISSFFLKLKRPLF